MRTAAGMRSGWVADMLSTAVKRVQDRLERRRTLQHLASLDDHSLADIGLTRFDVERSILRDELPKRG